jgi:PAS domain S-box-containing protein
MDAKANRSLARTPDPTGPDGGATARAGEPQPDPLGALHRQLLDEVPPICVTDHTGRLVYSNAAFEQIADAVTAADLAPARAEGGEISIVVGDRIERYALHCRPLKAPGAPGAITALTATVLEPLPDGDWARNALDAALERLEDITRLVTDWIWETNRNLVLTFVSPRVNQALGYHQIELTGRALPDLPAPPNDTMTALASPEGRRPFRDLEVQIADREGRARQFLMSGLPVYCRKDGSFLGYRGTAHDVTEIKWREAAMRKAKEDAELANRAKGEFLANMSHELRTPLNAIIGFSEIMGGELLGPLGSEKYKGYVHDISESARHLLAMINDILDAAKIESGHASLSNDNVDAVALIQSVIRLMTPRAQRAGLRLEAVTAPDLPTIMADTTKLKQILINLASNAVKFTRRDGRVELRAELSETGEFLFMVSDTGIGIAEADIPHALTPFGQVDSRLNREFEGTGLGLPLAKSLTELHGGRFDLVSQPDVGTTVTLRLPRDRVLRN